MQGMDVLTYPYVIARARAIAGNLLKIEDYHALLGCSKPVHAIDVLTQTGYREHLKLEAPPLDFSSVRQIILNLFVSSLEQMISSTPKSAAPLLLAYRELLESWSLVNALRASLFQGSLIMESQIIPCGLIERSSYEMLSSDLAKTVSLISRREAFREAAIHIKSAIETNRLGPLFGILKSPLDKCSEAILLLPSNEREVSRKLSYLHGDLGNILILYDCVRRQAEPEDASSRLLKKTYGLPKVVLDRLVLCRNLEQLTRLLTGTEFGKYLNHIPDNSPVDEFLEKLKLDVLRDKSRLALAGYPFRAATIMAALNLRLIEVANIMLCLKAVEGKISAENALKCIVVP